MSQGSKPRPPAVVDDQLARRAVIYGWAVRQALLELNPHNCAACHRAERILLGVDRPQPAPIPAPRLEPAAPVDDMVMDAFDVACAFRVTTQTVEDWLRAGKLPPECTFLDDRGRRRFHTAEIDKLLA